MSQESFHGLKDVRDIEVWLYSYVSLSSAADIADFQNSVELQSQWPPSLYTSVIIWNQDYLFVCVEVLRPSQPNGINVERGQFT